MALLLRAASSTITHSYAREGGTRFGRRFIAQCGASMYALDVPGDTASCARCIKITTERITCPECGGSGRIIIPGKRRIEAQCGRCKGSGQVTQ